MAKPFVVVGLGNPGPTYMNTRHNLGFAVIDELASRLKLGAFQEKYKGLLATTEKHGRKIFLLKPQTFMNLSGNSVAELVTFFKVDPSQDLVVAYDDLDLPVGNLRLRLGGGDGGHNGISSLIECLGTEDFPRIRIGIGRPQKAAVESYVLARIPESERPLFSEAVTQATAAVETALEFGFVKAMNTFNKRAKT